jgi:hypothetical protein
MKGEGKGASGKDGLGRVGDGRDRERWWCTGNIDRSCRQVMQDLADLAAVCVVSELRYTSVVFENRRRQVSGERQIVVVPTKEDGLEQNSEQAQLSREPWATETLAHASRHWLQRPLSTR